jgi:membrane protease YdiL (CAAX protease family)
MSTEIDQSGVVNGIAAAVRRHPVGAFLAWFFTVGQAIAFIPLVAQWTTGTSLPTEPFLLAATAVGLVLPTITITWFTDGAAGLRALQQSATRLLFPARWYAFAVLGVPFTLVAIWAAVAGPPEQVGGSGAAMAFSAGFLLHLVVVFVTFNLWEELAWMGFVQTRLQERHGAIRAAVLTGPVFALGHISQVIEGSVATTLVTLTLLVTVCIPFRALQALVYNRTDSLVPVALVHAAANATAAGSLVGTGLLDRLYPGDGAGGLVFPVLGALGLVAIAVTRGRLGRPSPARPLGDSELDSTRAAPA